MKICFARQQIKNNNIQLINLPEWLRLIMFTLVLARFYFSQIKYCSFINEILSKNLGKISIFPKQ